MPVADYEQSVRANLDELSCEEVTLDEEEKTDIPRPAEVRDSAFTQTQDTDDDSVVPFAMEPEEQKVTSGQSPADMLVQ